MITGKRSGFSLLELAIAVGIVGLLSAGAMRLFTTYTERQQEQATRETVKHVQEALVLYAARTGRLPCPADSTPDDPANAGRAQSTGNGACATGDDMVGVPWHTLSLPRERVFDGWNRRLTYAVDPALTADGALDMSALQQSNSGNGSSGGSGQGQTGACNQGNNAANGSACNSPSQQNNNSPQQGNATGNPHGNGNNGGQNPSSGGSFNLTTTGSGSGNSASGSNNSGSQSVSDWLKGKGLEVRRQHDDADSAFQDPSEGTGAAFVLISHGPNGEGAYATGARVSDAQNASANERENADGHDDQIFVQRQRTTPGADTVFDDVVTSLTVDTLAKRSGWYLTN